MATLPQPVKQILPIAGDALTVQLRPLPGVETEVILTIQRNGVHEAKFTLTELQQVLAVAGNLLGVARARALNVPVAPAKP